MSVLVANVKNSLARAGYQPGENHAFDYQMREMREDEAVLDRAGLALICIADDILLRVGLRADNLPFRFGRESCASQPSQPGRLQRSERAIKISRSHKSPHSPVM